MVDSIAKNFHSFLVTCMGAGVTKHFYSTYAGKQILSNITVSVCLFHFSRIEQNLRGIKEASVRGMMKR